MSASAPASGARPVLLATFDVPFAPGAAEFAVDAAVESGQALIVVNAAAVALAPISLALKATRRLRAAAPCLVWLP